MWQHLVCSVRCADGEDPPKKAKKATKNQQKKKSSGGKGPTLTWLCYLMSWRDSDLGKEIEHLAEVRH